MANDGSGGRPPKRDPEALFQVYLQLRRQPNGRGILRRMEEATGVPAGTLRRHRTRGKWEERAEALERKARELAEAKAAETEASRLLRHVAECQLVQADAVRVLKAKGPDELPYTSREAATNSMLKGIQLERLVVGDATDRVEVDARLVVSREDAIAALEAAIERRLRGEPRSNERSVQHVLPEGRVQGERTGEGNGEERGEGNGGGNGEGSQPAESAAPEEPGR